MNVLFLDWCVFPCRVTKQGAYKYNFGICPAWKYCAKMDNILPASSWRDTVPTGLKADVNGSGFVLQ